MIYLLCPVYGRLDYTLKCLGSFEEFIRVDFRIILCDDHPLCDTYKYFEDQPREYLTVIKGTGSLFWGGGINFALDFMLSEIKLMEDDRVVFFNNDISLVSDVPKELFEITSQHGVAHPALINHRAQKLSAGGIIRSWFPFRTQSELKMVSHTDILSVDYASARFLVVDPVVIQELGGIDRQLPHYAGDNDFVLRAKKHGFNPVIVMNWFVEVAELDSGIKIDNSPSLLEFIRSFWNIKSPNCIKYRWRFVRNHKGPYSSLFIVASMSIKAILGYVYFLLRPRGL